MPRKKIGARLHFVAPERLGDGADAWAEYWDVDRSTVLRLLVAEGLRSLSDHRSQWENAVTCGHCGSPLPLHLPVCAVCGETQEAERRVGIQPASYGGQAGFVLVLDEIPLTIPEHWHATQTDARLVAEELRAHLREHGDYPRDGFAWVTLEAALARQGRPVHDWSHYPDEDTLRREYEARLDAAGEGDRAPDRLEWLDAANRELKRRAALRRYHERKRGNDDKAGMQ